jgi:hypothetical protein
MVMEGSSDSLSPTPLPPRDNLLVFSESLGAFRQPVGTAARKDEI